MDESTTPRGQIYRGRASVPEPRIPWYRRWSGQLYRGVLGTGALAAAVTAVVALRPARDAADAAQFTGVTVAVGVPFSEYRQRLETPRPKPVGLRLLAASTPSAPGTPTPEEPTTTPPSSPETPSATTPTAPASRSPRLSRSLFPQSFAATESSPMLVRPQPTSSADVRRWNLLYARFNQLCGEMGLQPAFCGVQADVAASMTGGSGTASQRKAAAGKAVKTRVAELKGMRTVRVKGQKKRQPVGVVVSSNMDFTGLRGKKVMLSWQMWQIGGSKRLYGDWLNELLAYQIVPTTDHDTGSADFWIPLPKAEGPYFVRSRLTVDGSTLASSDSPPFG